MFVSVTVAPLMICDASGSVTVVSLSAARIAAPPATKVFW